MYSEGVTRHNRPLFVASYIREQNVNCILIDEGLVINIMLKSMIHDPSIKVKELSKSQMTIYGFNPEG